MWLLNRVGEQARRLRGLVCCVRCKTYFRKALAECPVCSGLSDAQLATLLAQRKAFRMSLGTRMLWGAALFAIAMIVATNFLK